MQSDIFFDRALSISVGSLSPTINWKDLARQEFLLPPMEEQRRIADILWAAENANVAYQKSLNALRRTEEICFTAALATYAEEAKRVPMGQVAKIDYGISAAVSPSKTEKTPVRILTNANIGLDGKINLEKESFIDQKDARFTLSQGDVIMVWRSGSPEHIGKTAIFDKEGTFVFASFLLRMKAGPSIHNVYLWRLLNHMRRTEEFTKNTSQQVNFKMNAAIFREVEIILPSLDVQQQIIRQLDEFDKAKANTLNHIANIESLKKRISTTFLQPQWE